MDLKKVAKQLRREIITNPKRAAILGVLVVVALWFWAPLVWGWIAEDDPAVEATAEQSAADSATTLPTDSPAQSDTMPKEAESPRHPWHQLVQWMDNDPRTSAATLMFPQRDPFLAPKTAVVEDQPEDQPEDEPEEVQQEEVTPQGLGMVLSSTIVGPDRRVARINGKSYQEAGTVKLTKDGQQIEFTLVKVYPRRVVLERDGKLFELKIPSAADSGRIELSESTH